MITSASIKAKEKEREQIAKSVDEFLARGGKVVVVESRASAGIKVAGGVGSEEQILRELVMEEKQ